jgi:hypothetical protein
LDFKAKWIPRITGSANENAVFKTRNSDIGDRLKVTNMAEEMPTKWKKSFRNDNTHSIGDREDNDTLNDQDDNGETKFILGMKPQRSEPTMFIKKMTKKEV